MRFVLKLGVVLVVVIASQGFCAQKRAKAESKTEPDTETSQTPVALPPHPRLLLDSNGIVALKQRVATADWAKASWRQLSNNAAKTLDQPVELPPRGGNWSHNYVCPVHGARLEQGKQIG